MNKRTLLLLVLIIGLAFVSPNIYAKGGNQRKIKVDKTELEALPDDSIIMEMPGTRAVIGTDSRYIINDTTVSPYNGIVHITSYWDHPTLPNVHIVAKCTGFMIDDNSVLTAAHCLKDGSSITLGPANHVVAEIGLNGTYVGESIVGSFIDVSSVWTASNNVTAEDWGVITLSSDVSSSVNIFDLDSSVTVNDTVKVAGYPHDKASGTLWQSNGWIGAVRALVIEYNNDSVKGMSGGPVYNSSGDVLGIHHGGPNTSGRNEACRIDSGLYSYLHSYHIS